MPRTFPSKADGAFTDDKLLLWPLILTVLEVKPLKDVQVKREKFVRV